LVRLAWNFGTAKLPTGEKRLRDATSSPHIVYMSGQSRATPVRLKPPRSACHRPSAERTRYPMRWAPPSASSIWWPG